MWRTCTIQIRRIGEQPIHRLAPLILPAPYILWDFLPPHQRHVSRGVPQPQLHRNRKDLLIAAKKAPTQLPCQKALSDSCRLSAAAFSNTSLASSLSPCIPQYIAILPEPIADNLKGVLILLLRPERNSFMLTTARTCRFETLYVAPGGCSGGATRLTQPHDRFRTKDRRQFLERMGPAAPRHRGPRR